MKHSKKELELTKIVEHVLKDEEESNLGNDGLQGGEGDLPCRHAEELSHRVEEPDLGEFDSEVAEKYEAGALPLLLQSRDFLLFTRVVSTDRNDDVVGFGSVDVRSGACTCGSTAGHR